MNQKQLVTAVRRMWNDASLDSHKKAYLMQRIMASRYIVAQQQKRCSGSALKSPTMPAGVPSRTFHDAKEGVLGCSHYKRRQVTMTRAQTVLTRTRSGCSHPRWHTMLQVQNVLQSSCWAEYCWCSTAAYAGGSRRVLLPCIRYCRQSMLRDLTTVHAPPMMHALLAHNIAVCCCRCQVVAPCCERVYTCRHCHDEAEDHRLEQSHVVDMVCMQCGLRQAAACTPCQLSTTPFL